MAVLAGKERKEHMNEMRTVGGKDRSYGNGGRGGEEVTEVQEKNYGGNLGREEKGNEIKEVEEVRGAGEWNGEFSLTLFCTEKQLCMFCI